MQTYTKEEIYALLTTSDWAVVRGLEAIYARQTSDEQESEITSYRNGHGFNGRDAKFGSALAVQIQEWRAADPATRYPFPLSTREGGQLDCGRRLIRKYSGQLADIANAKVAVADTEVQAEVAAERAAIQAVEIEDEYLVLG